jgi:hypothetical protein
MRTRIGRLTGAYCRPGLVTALVKVAMIGTWKGRTFLDDDSEFVDIAGFVPAEASTTALPDSPAAEAGGSHPVAA